MPSGLQTAEVAGVPVGGGTEFPGVRASQMTVPLGAIAKSRLPVWAHRPGRAEAVLLLGSQLHVELTVVVRVEDANGAVQAGRRDLATSGLKTARPTPHRRLDRQWRRGRRAAASRSRRRRSGRRRRRRQSRCGRRRGHVDADDGPRALVPFEGEEQLSGFGAPDPHRPSGSGRRDEPASVGRERDVGVLFPCPVLATS